MTGLDLERLAELEAALRPFANAQSISFTCDDGDTLMVLRYRTGEPTGACLNSLPRARSVLRSSSSEER